MRFIRELIMLILIIVFVVIIDNITQNITEKSLSKISIKISQVEENLYSENNKNKMNELSESWKDIEAKLAFYMEHNELEQISSKMTNAKISIEKNDTDEAIFYLDEIKFRVEHIKNKQKLELKNIF